MDELVSEERRPKHDVLNRGRSCAGNGGYRQVWCYDDLQQAFHYPPVILELLTTVSI